MYVYRVRIKTTPLYFQYNFASLEDFEIQIFECIVNLFFHMCYEFHVNI